MGANTHEDHGRHPSDGVRVTPGETITVSETLTPGSRADSQQPHRMRLPSLGLFSLMCVTVTKTRITIRRLILFPASKLVRISRLSFVGSLFEDFGEPIKEKVVELFWVLEMWPVRAMQRLVRKDYPEDDSTFIDRDTVPSRSSAGGTVRIGVNQRPSPNPQRYPKLRPSLCASRSQFLWMHAH